MPLVRYQFTIGCIYRIVRHENQKTRVSTQVQDYERQLAELREYARKMEYEVVMGFCEKVSDANTVAERLTDQ